MLVQVLYVLCMLFHIKPIIQIMSCFAAVRFYEAQRKKAGAHLFFNAFWLIPHFCINLMYMRDTMHQIDSGVIISFLKAILRKFKECVEIPLNISGAAAKQLTNRLRMLLGKEKNCKRSSDVRCTRLSGPSQLCDRQCIQATGRKEESSSQHACLRLSPPVAASALHFVKLVS